MTIDIALDEFVAGCDSPRMDRTLKQAAQFLGVSLKTVERYRAQGKFPHAYRFRRAWRIPEADLLPFLAQTPPDIAPPATDPHRPPDNHRQTVTDKQADTGNQTPADTSRPTITVTPTQAVTLSVPEYRHRLQIHWPKLGIHYEYCQPITETPLLRAALRWLRAKLTRNA